MSRPELPASASDAVLADAVRDGCPKSFEELWRQHAHAGKAAAQQFSAIADPEDIVSEAYLRIFRSFQRGGGPREAFRPYLYRTIRNIALDWRENSPSVPLEQIAALEDDQHNPETIAHNRSITARAFSELPERWRTALWYIDVEGMAPAEVAPLLGLTPNATSVLKIRAREGFKQAWLQAHVNDRGVPIDCRWTTQRMGRAARGALSRRTRERFDHHLNNCADCSALADEMDDLSGRLAGILLPIGVGTAVGATLLAPFLGTGSPASASPVLAGPGAVGRAKPLATRVALVAGAAVIAAVVVVTVAAVATGSLSTLSEPVNDAVITPPSEPKSVPVATPTDAGTPTRINSPVPIVPSPIAPPPASVPPPSASQQPAVSTPESTPPVPPTLIGPLPGMLANDPQPTFEGTGEPGARITVQRLDPMTGASTDIVTSTVGSNGTWTAVAPTALPDGTHQLLVSQTNSAGKRSALVTVTITIDTVALPPVLHALPPGLLVLIPDMGGTAEPGATVVVENDLGNILGSTVADANGAWLCAIPDPQRDGAAIIAVQTDLAGNTSARSAPTAAMDFDRPQVTTASLETELASGGGSTSVSALLSGHEGMQVQVFVDGVSTGNMHVLESGPIARVTAPLADGSHTLGVRYIDPVSPRAGSIYTLAITIA